MKLTNVPLRIGIWFLALVELTVGVVATLTPRVFYDDVPWVSLAPPYSEHLMRDYGAMNLALGVVSFVAAITMEQLMVRAALAAYLVFAIPHLLFHLTHHQRYTTTAAITETTALVVAALLPAALLALTRGRAVARAGIPPIARRQALQRAHRPPRAATAAILARKTRRARQCATTRMRPVSRRPPWLRPNEATLDRRPGSAPR